MKAAIVTGTQAPSYAAFEEPDAKPGTALVKVRAAALTNLDVLVAERRHYFSTDDEMFVVGKEAVAETQTGERLFFNATSMVAPFGSMAERALVRPEMGLPVPDGIPDALAAAIGNAGLAAWLPLSWRARLRQGETVLILGATGTSGLIAVAAAKLLGAGRIVAAGRNPDALAKATALGADAIVSLETADDLSSEMREAANGPVDVVLDYLNGSPAEAALKVMNVGARMIQIGSLLAPGIQLHAQTARRNSLDVLGFAYYHAPIPEQARAYELLCEHALAGTIKIDMAALPLSAFGDAWQRQKAGSKTRLVIVPDAES